MIPTEDSIPTLKLAAPPFVVKEFNLSGEKIKFKIQNPQDSSGVIYFNLHDNENTAVEVMDSLLPRIGGKFIELQFRGDRWIGGWQNQYKHFWFDPNRIYTDLGIYKTLRAYKSYNSYSRRKVKELGQFITDSLLKDAQLVVALHNNTKGYSIQKYMKDSIFEEDADTFFINPQQSPHDFFYVLDTGLYELLINKGYNAIIQSATSVEDDGSLSVFCAKNNIAYVNVEAKMKHYQQQKEMIELLQDIIWCDTLFNMETGRFLEN